MFRRCSHRLGIGAAALMFLVLAVGCSSENPLTSISGTADGVKNSHSNLSPSSGEVELNGRVASVDTTARVLMLVGDPTVIVVSETAEIVFKDGGSETPITLADINPGDSAEVRGDVQGDGSLLADRVRIRAEDNNQNEVETAGRIAIIDPVARTLTLTGNPMVINVSPTAEIVQKNSGSEIPIALSDISPGDSVDVRGDLQPDGSLLADRVRLRLGLDDDFVAELEFTDIIATIDYTGNQFTVIGRTETITVDANTYIFVKVGHGGTPGMATSGGSDDDDDMRLHKPIAFTDLQAGDTVEVYANTVAPNTLYAVAVELEDGAFENGFQIEFKDLLATVDAGALTVTFQNQSWNGFVEANAELEGLNGESLLLSDFAAGELVEVKGFNTSGNTLSIVRLHKENSAVAGFESDLPSTYRSSSAESIEPKSRYDYNITGEVVKVDRESGLLGLEKENAQVKVAANAKVLLLPDKLEVPFDFHYFTVGTEVTVRGNERNSETILGEIFEVRLMTSDLDLSRAATDESIEQKHRYMFNVIGKVVKVDRESGLLGLEKENAQVKIAANAQIVLIPSKLQIPFDYQYVRPGTVVTVRGDEKDSETILGEVFEINERVVSSEISNSTI